MGRVLRRLTLLVMPMFLSACDNRVVSERPWFTAASEAGAPRMRTGLWVAVEPKCRFDERVPAESWPKCAHSSVMRGDEVLSTNYQESGSGLRIVREYSDWSKEEHIVAAGDPRILQQAGCSGALGMVKEEAPADDFDLGLPKNDIRKRKAALAKAGYDRPPPHPRDPRNFCYYGVRPLKFDNQGFIVATRSWPVFCGPFPDEKRQKATGSSVTETPFAGLHVVYQNCTADSEAALRNAALSSEAMILTLGPKAKAMWPDARWVREGYY